MTQLVHFDAARKALALATSVDEVKLIRDQAEAMRAYVQQQGISLDMQNQCAEIKLRAERRLGEMLAEMDLRPGNAQWSHDVTNVPPKLADLGISKMQSSRWQAEATVPEEVFERHVAETKAAAKELTSISLLRLAPRRDADSVPTPPMPEGRYRCIVVDPPWPMAKLFREDHPLQGATLDYPVMALEEIGALPLPDLVDTEGCHVYLWATQKYLPDAFDLFDSWGIKYECLMTWVKPTGMTPYSWMYNTEHVLFGRVGSLPVQQMGLKLSFEAPTRGHSVKPEEFYERVRLASPAPRLDMFARTIRPGFTGWGNEVPYELATQQSVG